MRPRNSVDIIYKLLFIDLRNTVSDFSKSERNFSEQKHINHGKDLKIGEIKNGGNLNNSLVLITYF